MRLAMFACAVLAYTGSALKLAQIDYVDDYDLAETDIDCDCENEAYLDEDFDNIDDDMLAETEIDLDQAPPGAPGSQDMSAINLIENERNMHMVPPPPPPCCCCNNAPVPHSFT